MIVEIMIVVIPVLFASIWAILAQITWGDEDPNHLKLPEDWEPRGGRLYKGWLR